MMNEAISVDQQQLFYRIAVTMLPGVGGVLAKNLISYCGSVEGVFQSKKLHLEKIPGIGEKVAKAIREHSVFQRAEEELKFIEDHKITPLFFLDKEFPKRLHSCSDAPAMIYYKGDLNLNDYPIISIVGTRNATEYGKLVTEKMVEGLKPYVKLIISGLAFGIDVTAHKACLNNDIPTAGVLAHGLDKIFPTSNYAVGEKMLEKGGLISEFPSNTIPEKEFFPRRNRIVAGLSDAVIVVESDIRGGAMITANIAHSYNRDIFAVPGNILNKYSSGCNYLIQKQKAYLYTSADSLAEEMGWKVMEGLKKSKPQGQLFVDLTDEERRILDIFRDQQELTIDQLVLISKLSQSKLSSLLLELEFKGVIKSLPGKRYLLL